MLDIVGLEIYLSDELKGKVDLVPRECIRPELEKYTLPEVVKNERNVRQIVWLVIKENLPAIIDKIKNVCETMPEEI